MRSEQYDSRMRGRTSNARLTPNCGQPTDLAVNCGRAKALVIMQTYEVQWCQVAAVLDRIRELSKKDFDKEPPHRKQPVLPPMPKTMPKNCAGDPAEAFGGSSKESR